MRIDQPQWHKFFPLGTSVILISSIIRSYCRAALVAVRRAGADRSESSAPPLVFEEVSTPTPPNNTPSIDAISTPSIDAPIPDQLAYAAAKVFGKSVLRPRQVTAVHKLVYCKESNGKLLVVDRTGGGKSLILSLAAVMVGGITLIIIPLLALTANQMSKLKEAISDHGDIEVHHLDELKKVQVNTKLIPRMLGLSKDSSTTMFILSSPQYLAENSLMRNALVQCQARQTLRLVAIDEVHLYTQHGRTFRECIRYLRDVFFRVVFDVAKTYHPLFLAMTATFTHSMVEYFSYLTNVEWGVGYCPITRLEDGPSWGGTVYPHQLWASFSDFRQRYIKMGLAVSGQISQVAFPKLISHLKDNPNSYAALEFLSSKVLTDKLPFEINVGNCDDFLDSLYKEESWLIRVFGISSVKKYNVASFFFQLIGSKILSFETKGSNAVVVFSRDNAGQYSFKNIVNWEGFLFRTKERGHLMERLTFGELINRDGVRRWKAFVEESSGLN